MIAVGETNCLDFHSKFHGSFYAMFPKNKIGFSNYSNVFAVHILFFKPLCKMH